jgi:trimethylamine--corrinoid protein Co-methyltransferase
MSQTETAAAVADRGRRRGGSESGPRQRNRRSAGGLHQLPWRRLVNPYRPIEVLTPEQMDRVHEASMRILEELGLEFLSEEALYIVARAVASVDRSTRRVSFDRWLIA